MSLRELTMADMSPLMDKIFVPLRARPKFRWPENKPLALVVQMSIEYFGASHPVLYSGGPPLVPTPVPAGQLDFLNWTWRNYGTRVGLWRLLDIFITHDVRASACTNAIVHEVYPEITEALREARCDMDTAHGYIQDRSLLEFANDLEGHREYLRECLEAHERATGVRPRGWVSPAGGQLPQTFTVLAEHGVEWVVFPCDDQPFLFDAGGRLMVGMPHSIELADYNTLTRHGHAFAQFAAAVHEQVDVLAEEADRTGTGHVAIVNVHPHVMGQPFRVRQLGQLIADLKQRSDLWWATQTEVATYYRNLPFNADRHAGLE